MSSPENIWIKNYPPGLKWDIEIEKKPVFSMLLDTVAAHGEKPALDFLGKKYNWNDIGGMAKKFAKGLQDLGVKKGDKVGLFLPNSPYYMVSYFGVMMTGATVVNLNPLYAEEELAGLIEDSECDLIITVDLAMLYDKINKMLKVTRLSRVIVGKFTDVLPFLKNILFSLVKCADLAKVEYDKRVLRFSDVSDNNGDVNIPEITADEDVAVIQFTGGTTGLPKGAMLTHYNVYSNAMQAVAWFYQIKDGEGKMLGVLPFFHVFAMTAVLNFSVAKGLEIIAMPRFDLADALKIIQKKKPTMFPAVPAIYSAINNSPLRDKYDLSSLKYCLSGGAPLPVEVKRKFEEKTGCVLIEGYGLSESSPVACGNPIEGENKPGSIGLPFPQTIVEIIDREDRMTTLPLGKRGELCIRGPQVMKGYWNKPDATADTLRPTGDGDMRLHTGDVAIMDEDGYVFIVDRMKDMIITNGYNVYPRNVEEAIYKHPSVEEVIVAGLPDEQRGEIVKAWIKLRDGRELTQGDLKEFLLDKISPMEIPKRVEFRDEALPKTMIGKLSRKAILEEERAKKS